jgi:nitrogen fixation protein FixH
MGTGKPTMTIETLSARARERQFAGWHMLAAVGVFFAVVIAVNIALAVAATGTFPGLVVENSYVASQHYDELIASSRAQDRKGWRHQLTVEGGVLHFSLSQAGGEPLPSISVVAHVGRPSPTAEDRLVDFVPVADGSFVTTEPLAPGLWEVDLRAERGAEILFRRSQEVFVNLAEPQS